MHFRFWPIASFRCCAAPRRLRGKADINQQITPVESVENDPEPTNLMRRASGTESRLEFASARANIDQSCSVEVSANANLKLRPARRQDAFEQQ